MTIKPTELETRHKYHCMFCGSELELIELPLLVELRCPQCKHMSFNVVYCACDLDDCTALTLVTSDNWYDEDWATLTPVTDADGGI